MHDHFYDLDNHFRPFLQEGRYLFSMARGGAQAEEGRENDEGQHPRLGEEVQEVGGGQAAHQQVAPRTAFGRQGSVGNGLHAGEGVPNQGARIGQEAGDDGHAAENHQRPQQNLADDMAALQSGNGTGDAEKDQRNHQHENQVEENLAEGTEETHTVPEEEAKGTANDDTRQEHQRKRIVFKKIIHRKGRFPGWS